MRGQRGFTLLEMLLAIGLLVLLAGLAYGTLRIGVRGWETADAHADSSDALRVAWPFLHRTLEDAQPLSDSDGRALFDGHADALHWAAELPAHLATGGAQLLSLEVEHDAAQQPRGLRLSYGEVAPVASGDGSPRRDAILVDRLAELRIRYFGLPAQGGPPEWLDSWQERDSLPQLVRIDIRPVDGPAWPSLYAHPRLAGAIISTAQPEAADPEVEDARDD